MKTINLVLFLTVVSCLVLITSCNKEDESEKLPTALDYINDITGTYEGTYDLINGSKSSDSAHADVQHMGGYLVEIHCYGEMLDTTFRMNIYANHDSVMICATGTNFEEMYGHELGSSHMNHHDNGETEWSHHMDDDHETGDIHFGGFNVNHHTLNYTFRIEGNGTLEYIRFQGSR